MIFANIFTSVADTFTDPARRAKYQGLLFGGRAAHASKTVVRPPAARGTDETR